MSVIGRALSFSEARGQNSVQERQPRRGLSLAAEPHPHVKDEALQRHAQVGRQRPQAQLARGVDLAPAVVARVLVPSVEVLHLQRRHLQEA